MPPRILLFFLAVFFMGLVVHALRSGRVTLTHGQTAWRPSIFYWIVVSSYLLIAMLLVFFFFYSLLNGA